LSEGIELSIYIFGKFESEIIKAIAKHKLSQKPVFFDIGANIGYYSLFIASLNKKVYAFEPSKKNHTLFEKSIKY
jgi:predicted RNA methylase